MDGHILMIRRYRVIGLASVLASSALIVTLGASGCGSTECNFTATCVGTGAGPAGDGGEDAPVVAPKDCDLTKSPTDSPSCVDETIGIFVDAAKGKPAAKGTKLEPVSTIAAAISLAVASQRARVYVCDGIYGEAIKLTSPVSVYGGFDCDWAIKPQLKPRVQPSKGPAIEITTVAGNVVIEDIAATGVADTTIGGASAVGAFIMNSKVFLRGLLLTASTGQGGDKGASQSNYLSAASPGTKGVSAIDGKEVTCTCADSSTSQGGHGADGAGTGVKNGASTPPVTTPLANAGSSSATSCMPGTKGADGEGAGVGEPVLSPGVLTASGWDVSKLGGAGSNGHPAQGGGGGGAETDNGFAGGGGGCGGCGGAGGAAGKNGGASIALVSIESVVTLEQSTLMSAAGGRGGDGGDGQGGQDGADGGGGICKGGFGGAGAGGSGGAGGAGGDSIAIAWMGGMEPAVMATALMPATGGPPGVGGKAGTGSGATGIVGRAGNAGKAVAVYHQR